MQPPLERESWCCFLRVYVSLFFSLSATPPFLSGAFVVASTDRPRPPNPQSGLIMAAESSALGDVRSLLFQPAALVAQFTSWS